MCSAVILYGLCPPILIIETRLLGIVCFHAPSRISKQSESVVHVLILRPRGFIFNFERRGFGWNLGSALWIWDGRECLCHKPYCSTNGSVVFLPFYPTIVLLMHLSKQIPPTGYRAPSAPFKKSIYYYYLRLLHLPSSLAQWRNRLCCGLYLCSAAAQWN